MLVQTYFNIDSSLMRAFVFEKNDPTDRTKNSKNNDKKNVDVKNRIHKDGFHIIFPKIVMNVNMRYFFLRELCYKVKGDDLSDFFTIHV